MKMHLSELGFREVRRGALVLLLVAIGALQGCAGSNSYVGIPLIGAAADPEVQSLAHRARAGDKHAQLALGIRFEEGRGVRRDLRKAKKLYRLAASDTGGATHLYVPPVGKLGRGRVVAVDSGIRQPGLAEAEIRLRALR